MSNCVYSSSLGKYMEGYLAQRRSLGFKALDIEYGLRSIDHFLVASGFAGITITKAIYEEWWKSTDGQMSSTRYSKASVFIRFLKYLTCLGIDCYIPRHPRKFSSTMIPYIFSEDEIQRIFLSCDNLRMKERHTESIMISIPALFRLMYSTAVRISEALDIRLGNVDFNHHVIKLEYTKNGHQRFAPINDSLESVLKKFISYRNRLPYNNILSPESHLFISSQGEPLKRITVLYYMHLVLADAGIAKRENEEGPHLHCIRHTACVHAMVKSVKNGMDLYCSLPIISVFMGHRKVTATETYLRLTRKLYPDLIEQDLSVTSSINNTIKRANLIYDEENC